MNMKRMRGRGGGQFRHGGGGSGGGQYRQGGGGGGHQPMNRNHVFDSTGPDVRLRGTAQQLFEKYLQLGRDATGGGDRVMAEGYFQHAEHYFRILNAMTQVQQQQQVGHPYQQRRWRDDPGMEQGPEQAGDSEQGQDSQQEPVGEAQQLEPYRRGGHPPNGQDLGDTDQDGNGSDLRAQG
jgi:hypothetical protein